MSDKITLVTKDSIENVCEERIYKHSKYLNDLVDSSSQIDSGEDIRINLEVQKKTNNS